MSEATLYRKYRPQEFDHVRGQEHVVSVLQGAIKNNSIAHAYLFSGSRGIGKTSVARIFAHALGTTDNDIHEVDAASNRKIEHIRELRDAVSTLPLESQYKVYIIDEVHMLTTPAFNALLKTLEEPPKHVIFILATTEMDKLPDTIISRCQTFQFKRPHQKLLQETIAFVAGEEGYSIEESASALIALLADGSFRDANGVVQKVISTLTKKEKTISVEDVENVTGSPRSVMIENFIKALSEGNTQEGIEALAEVSEANSDMRVFAKLVIARLRYVLLLRFAPQYRARLMEEISQDEIDFLDSLAQEKNSRITSRALDTFLKAYDDMRFAYLPHLPLEVALMKLEEENKRGDTK